jgi:hypothetical protein
MENLSEVCEDAWGDDAQAATREVGKRRANLFAAMRAEILGRAATP